MNAGHYTPCPWGCREPSTECACRKPNPLDSALQRAYSTHCADGYIPDEDETTPQEPTSGPVPPRNDPQAPGGKAAERRGEGRLITLDERIEIQAANQNTAKAPFQPGQSHPDWRQWACERIETLSSALDETLDDLTRTLDRAEQAEDEAKVLRGKYGYITRVRDDAWTSMYESLDRAKIAEGERDRARDTAAALEAENARLAAKVERVKRLAYEISSSPDCACVSCETQASVSRDIDRALSDTTGEATRCSTCGQPMDSPGCAKSLLGISGHPGNGGCEATR